MFSDSKERYASVGLTTEKSEWVDRVKYHAVQFEDATNNNREFVGEAARLRALAITHLETATMFAVKAISRQ